MTTFRTTQVVCLVAAMVVASGSAVSAQTNAEIARGQEIAERVCAGCHVSTGDAIMFQGKQVPSWATIAALPDRSRETLEAFVSTPRHPMPAMPLQTSEIRAVVDYIISFK